MAGLIFAVAHAAVAWAVLSLLRHRVAARNDAWGEAAQVLGMHYAALLVAGPRISGADWGVGGALSVKAWIESRGKRGRFTVFTVRNESSFRGESSFPRDLARTRGLTLGGPLKGAARQAVEAIQSRLKGAGAGRLSLSESGPEIGALSLAVEPGRLSAVEPEPEGAARREERRPEEHDVDA